MTPEEAKQKAEELYEISWRATTSQEAIAAIAAALLGGSVGMWRRDVENAPKGRPILAHDRVSLMENPRKPLVLTWFKYNGAEAWRDWDGEPHTPTRWMVIPDVND